MERCGPVFDSDRRVMRDWEAVVLRRLEALDYAVLNDAGAVVEQSTGNVLVAADDDSGGATPAQLAALGYTPDQISVISGSSTGIPAPVVTAPVAVKSVAPASSGTSAAVSGLSSLTNAFSSIFKTVNPTAGTAAASATFPITAQTQGTLLMVVVIAFVLWIVFRD